MNPYDLIAEFSKVMDSLFERDKNLTNLSVSANPQALTVSCNKANGESMTISVPRTKKE